MDFTVPVDHRMKIKESKKIDIYINQSRKLKKLWNVKVMVIPSEADTLGIVYRGFEIKISGRIEKI